MLGDLLELYQAVISKAFSTALTVGQVVINRNKGTGGEFTPEKYSLLNATTKYVRARAYKRGALICLLAGERRGSFECHLHTNKPKFIP